MADDLAVRIDFEDALKEAQWWANMTNDFDGHMGNFARAHLAVVAERDEKEKARAHWYKEHGEVETRRAFLEKERDEAQKVLRGYAVMMKDYETKSSADEAKLAVMTAERDDALEAAERIFVDLSHCDDKLTASEAARGRMRKAVEAVVSSLSASSYTRQLCEKALAKPGKDGSDE